MLDRPALQPSAALAAYCERLAAGQRVVVFGSSSSGLAELLVERGARLVHVYDPDATRAAEAATRNRSQNLWFAPLADGDFALRERAFDLAIVENLSSHPDPSALLKRVRRALTGRGAALVASPNPEVRLRLLPHSAPERGGLDYYALYDVAAAQFPLVRMLGQMPFVGYAIADFATESAPEPTLDAGFVPNGAEEPEWFCALASEQPHRLDEFAIIQLPFRSALGSTPSAWLEQQLRTAQQGERRARGRMAEVEAENARLGEGLRGPPGAAAGKAELIALRRELEQKEAWIRELEARATTADERADQTQSELDEERAHGTALREQLEAERHRSLELSQSVPAVPPAAGLQSAEFEAELLRHATRSAELESTILERDVRLGELDRTVDGLRTKVSDLSQADEEDAARQISALERMLSERGAELSRALKDLKESERIGRELVRELEAARLAPEASPTPEDSVELAELRVKLDRLAALNAEREADFTAARWTIDKLEAKIADTADEHDGRRPGVDPRQRDALRHELERQLSLAQAELQRQAALIDQLRERRAPSRAD